MEILIGFLEICLHFALQYNKILFKIYLVNNKNNIYINHNFISIYLKNGILN